MRRIYFSTYFVFGVWLSADISVPTHSHRYTDIGTGHTHWHTLAPTFIKIRFAHCFVVISVKRVWKLNRLLRMLLSFAADLSATCFMKNCTYAIRYSGVHTRHYPVHFIFVLDVCPCKSTRSKLRSNSPNASSLRKHESDSEGENTDPVVGKILRVRAQCAFGNIVRFDTRGKRRFLFEKKWNSTLHDRQRNVKEKRFMVDWR